MADFDPGWMWERARSLMEQSEKLRQRFVTATHTLARRPTWEPPVDVLELPHCFLILVGLPGVHPQGIEIRLTEATVSVSGARQLPVVYRQAQVHRLEIPYGRFERQVQLPDGRYSLAGKHMLHGCAVITVNKL